MAPKNFDDFEHHKPRTPSSSKNKKHRTGFSEDVIDKRATRITFKNYVRELEETALNLSDDEVWVVERRFEGDDDWHEVASAGSEEEADVLKEEYENEGSGDSFHVIRG